jgi:membrane protein
MKGIGDRLRAIYNRVNQLSGGLLDVIKQAFQSFGRARAAEAAASMAYYVLFSLFPLLLALVAGAAIFLEREQGQVQQRIVDVLTEVIPVSPGVIERNFQEVLRARGTIGTIGLIGLIWSASGVFTTLALNINRAWPETEPRGLLQGRLLALAIVGVLFLLLILSLLSATVISWLPRVFKPLGHLRSLTDTRLWALASSLVPWVFTFFMFLALYRWMPNRSVPWAAAAWGALTGAILWEAAKRAFSWYVSSGLVQFELVYGSLGAIVALMFWIYLTSWITLFGAHLSAAIGTHNTESGETSGEQTGTQSLVGVKNGDV